MAMADLDFCQSHRDSSLPQKPSKFFRYHPFYRRRKPACKSKPPHGIVVKKSDDDSGRRLHQEPDDVQYRYYVFRRRRIAHRSKPARGIVVKKPISGEISSYQTDDVDDDDDDDDDDGKIYRCGIDQYERLNMISYGSYGVVHRARDKKSGAIVAIKEEFDGLSTSSIREIAVLKALGRHPCIVGFKKVFIDDDCDGGVYIVMEYMETDLKRYINYRKTNFSDAEVKCLMQQLLEGVKFLHENELMHRDLKPSNILLNCKGELKLCDFGLSREFYSNARLYSPHVATLGYKAPELLLGAKSYSSAIDMWSVGCIMAELLLKEVLFKGNSEIDQLENIYRILGKPDETLWPGFLDLPGSRVNFVDQPCNQFRMKFSTAAAAENCEGVAVLTEAGFDLLSQLLTYNPAKRITAESALEHAWFQEF